MDSLSIGEMKYTQLKKQIIRVNLIIDLVNPIEIIKLDIVKSIAKTENKIDTKLN